jgi:hypothetical protein
MNVELVECPEGARGRFSAKRCPAGEKRSNNFQKDLDVLPTLLGNGRS